MTKQKYDNEFKFMIVELLKSGIKTKQVSDDYNLNVSMISRWRREYVAKSSDFSKKREVFVQEQEFKALQKAVSIFSKNDQ